MNCMVQCYISDKVGNPSTGEIINQIIYAIVYDFIIIIIYMLQTFVGLCKDILVILIA